MLREQSRPRDLGWAAMVRCAEGGQQQARHTSETQSSSTETAAANLTEKGEKLKDEMDALIDEIDEVLEENAEEFVKNYVQRGGE
jgi:prokaryotic ubiquitin-like protein Pup